MCERCELPVQDTYCDLPSEQGWPRYGWRRVEILESGWAIGRAKKKGKNSLGGVWYWFYGKLLNQTGPRDGRAVLQLHPALDLLYHGPGRARVQMPQRWTAVHWVLLLGYV